MTSIIKATEKDAAVLAALATETFIQSHGHSAPAEDITNYITEKYSTAAFIQELSEPQNIYHILYHDDKPAGFSKIIYDHPYSDSVIQNITKLERIYLLQEFYNLKLGKVLFEFNVALAKQAQQKGIWLYVWVENARAFNFYTKAGFTIIGSYDFKVSATHSNPNHRMYLEF
ncbi:GNAT family N-acetyltransferase [Ferruginibacter sp. SUN106]|uniref:GNAT family N-acetyltransferase n=1 Tax=Ferruginibacter sp. SUN106 TaxID=2978348 RepID=UPI003D363DF8